MGTCPRQRHKVCSQRQACTRHPNLGQRQVQAKGMFWRVVHAGACAQGLTPEPRGALRPHTQISSQHALGPVRDAAVCSAGAGLQAAVVEAAAQSPP